jgi:hypothetical protein
MSKIGGSEAAVPLVSCIRVKYTCFCLGSRYAKSWACRGSCGRAGLFIKERGVYAALEVAVIEHSF